MYGPTLLGVSVALENVAAVTNKRYFTGSLNLTKLTNSYYTLHQTVLQVKYLMKQSLLVYLVQAILLQDTSHWIECLQRR